MIATEKFIYKRLSGITALTASFTDFTYKRHCHEEYAFGVTLRGLQRFHLDGSLELSHPHGVILFNPEQVHDGCAQDKTGLDYVMLYIQPELFLEMAGKKDIVRFSSPIVYNRQLEQSILNLSRAIMNCADNALVSELLLALADNLVDVDLTAANKKDDALTKKAKDIIHCSLEDVLRLDDICQQLNISKFKLIRSFKSSTGMSPYQYYLNCKIAFARRIIEKNHDVYAAVSDCNYFDIAHLNKHFKSVYGTTAHEYLNLI